MFSVAPPPPISNPNIGGKGKGKGKDKGKGKGKGKNNDFDGSGVTPCIIETLIKVIRKILGANTILNQKMEFKN
jgi:hypothetical protein